MSRHVAKPNILRSTKPVKFRGAIRVDDTSESKPITFEGDDIESISLLIEGLLRNGHYTDEEVVLQSSYTGPSGVTIWNIQRHMNYPRKKGPSMLEQLEALCRDVAKLDDNGPDPHVSDVKYEAIRLIMKFFTPEGDSH